MLAVVHATSQFCCQPWKKELYNTNSSSASPVTIVRRIIHIRVREPRVAAAIIQSKKYGTIITMAFVRLLLLLQLLLSTKNLSSREVKTRNSLHFCLTKNFSRLNPLQHMI